MVQARPRRPASRDTWLSWLQFGSGTVIEEMSPYREDQVLDVLCRRVCLEGWKIVAKYGRRCLYEIRGRAWKFLGTLVALISPDNDNYVDSAMKAFENTEGLLKLTIQDSSMPAINQLLFPKFPDTYFP